MAFTQVPSKSSGDVFTVVMWNTYIEANLNKLGVQMHRQLTVAQFLALTGLEDGDEAYVEVDGTNGIVWHLRYDLASTKWRVLGGAPLFAEVTTSEGTTSTSYADLATVGPSITTPLTGDYEIRMGENGQHPGSSGSIAMTAVKLGATATADADGFGVNTAVSTAWNGVGRTLRRSALAVSTVLKLQYKTSSVSFTHTAKDRSLAIVPTRIG